MVSRYKKTLISLFEKIHLLQKERFANRLLALEVQEELILRISRSEHNHWRAKHAQKLIKAELKKPSDNKPRAVLLKGKIEVLAQRIDHQRYYRWCLRSVGDAIAYIYGNKWDLKNYAFKEDPGFLVGKKGSRLERALLRRGFSMGLTLVLNDLTNSLRHGDLTFFRPDIWPEGDSPFIIIEAKSGKGGNKDRMQRQIVAAQDLNSYLTTDTRQHGGINWYRFEALEPSKHHYAAAAKLIDSLPKGGCIFREIELGLAYFVMDCNIPEEKVSEMIGSTIDPSWMGFTVSVNDIKGENLGYFPFPLTFSKPESLFRFYNGEFIFWILVDKNAVNNILASKKLAIEFSDKDGYPWRIISTDKTSSFEGSFVGFHIIGRLGAEFLSLSWLLDHVAHTEYELEKKITDFPLKIRETKKF